MSREIEINDKKEFVGHSNWLENFNIPIFTEDRDYIDRFLKVEE